ncbi:MAG: polyribonucleotide nucleotidyltransferase [bacterium]|nr:MAG: polyribonucleotide nucleotidyltransferase [bacterium]
MATRVEVEIGHGKFSIETGEMAKQAGGSVFVQFVESAVLGAATADSKVREGIDFFPLTVDYREKFYAAGKIPGGFFKREGRPTEKETLVCRLTDRPIRPLFPKGFANETQVLLYAVSHDAENDTDVLAVTAASAALMVSDVPFNGPIAAVRVGHIDGSLVVNPTLSQREDSIIDMVVVGSAESIMMVEGGAREIPEHQIVEALGFAHESIKKICRIQQELASKVNKPKMSFAAPEGDTEWHEKIRATYSGEIKTAVCVPGKMDKSLEVSKLKKRVIESLTGEENRDEFSASIKGAFGDVQKQIVRKMILDEGKRVDGRGLEDVRPITIRTGILPRAHGSVLFTRGETQALVVTTLGTGLDEQTLDNIEGKRSRTFMLHYNFPPFSVGEVKFTGGPGRREIGHGALAERAVKFALPDHEEFPYTVRIVSEILESNGSSSMASVCGGTLSLLDAGVKIRASVAGVAMGLIDEDGRTAILTDILGMEDALGDMDFKVAGSREGITAIQMDIKIDGISLELLEKALEQARSARLHILDEMQKAVPAPREDISQYAPRMITMKIPPDMIGQIIGPGGKNIRNITETTEAQVDLEDDGLVRIYAADLSHAEAARKMIEGIVRPVNIGDTFQGRVVRIVDFGAFVEIKSGTEGLVHISHIANRRIERVSDVISEGEEIWVKVIDIDPRTRKIRLSHKEALNDREQAGKQ